MNISAPTLNDRVTHRRAYTHIAVVLCLVCALAFGMMVCSFAAGTASIESGIKTGMQQAFKLLPGHAVRRSAGHGIR